MTSTLWLRPVLVALAGLSAFAGPLAAQDFRIEEVPSVDAVAPSQMKPRAIVFSDHRDDKLNDREPG